MLGLVRDWMMGRIRDLPGGSVNYLHMLGLAMSSDKLCRVQILCSRSMGRFSDQRFLYIG